jgi:Cu/Ag efflux protein CusF
MLRLFVCATLALLFATNMTLAADKASNKKKKGQAVAGTVKTIDATAGKLTVSVKKKKMVEDKDFTVGDNVKVVTFSGADKKQLTGKAGLKDIKTGDKVRVQIDGTGNVVSLQVGAPPKKPKKNKNDK